MSLARNDTIVIPTNTKPRFAVKGDKFEANIPGDMALYEWLDGGERVRRVGNRRSWWGLSEHRQRFSFPRRLLEAANAAGLYAWWQEVAPRTVERHDRWTVSEGAWAGVWRCDTVSDLGAFIAIHERTGDARTFLPVDSDHECRGATLLGAERATVLDAMNSHWLYAPWQVVAP